MIKRQLELGLGGGNGVAQRTYPRACRKVYRPRAAVRARWWFERMREVVDLAPDIEPRPLTSENVDPDQRQMAV